jgi:hypothetical protein
VVVARIDGSEGVTLDREISCLVGPDFSAPCGAGDKDKDKDEGARAAH